MTDEVRHERQAETTAASAVNGQGIVQCEATRQDGRRCEARIYEQDGHFCMWHSRLPELVQSRREWQSKGGIAKHGSYPALPPADVKLRCVNDLLGYLEILVEETQAGRLGLRLASELRAMVETAAQIIGTDQLEGRLQELEERLLAAQEGAEA